MTPDPTPNNEHEPAWRDQERVLNGMLEISNLVGSVLLIDDILDQIVRITSDLMGVSVCSIYLFDDARKRLVLRSNRGFEATLRGKASFEIGKGIPGWVARTGLVVALADAANDPRYAPLPSTLELDVRAYLCVPLRIQDEIAGVITARKKRIYEFNQDEILFFETVCKQVAIVLEKSRMYEEKIAAERMAAVGISLTGVAHYIKNVLMTMQGSEHLVEQGLERGDLKNARGGWSVLKRANHKIRGLVENILNYCRETEPQRLAVPLNRMIEEMLETIGETARERGVDLRRSLDPEVGEIWIQPESIYDALLNLVANGIEAATESDRAFVEVRTERLHDRNQIRIDVIDNGDGIPEDNREKIFNLFFTTKGKGGTGIGLAATRKIIEEHSGSITLESRIGEGTHFTIHLPIHAFDTGNTSE